jgi:uncharacterized membrane protein YjjB (DUF3815 family)
MSVFVQIITALAGSFGYALMFNVRRGHALWAAVNGMFSWAVYLVVYHITGDILVASAVASIFANIYAQIAARVRMTPATQFMIIGLIPLIPGAMLYYSLYYTFVSDMELAGQYGFSTLKYVFGIVIGISLVWATIHAAGKIIKKFKFTHKTC